MARILSQTSGTYSQVLNQSSSQSISVNVPWEFDKIHFQLKADGDGNETVRLSLINSDTSTIIRETDVSVPRTYSWVGFEFTEALPAGNYYFSAKETFGGGNISIMLEPQVGPNYMIYEAENYIGSDSYAEGEYDVLYGSWQGQTFNAPFAFNKVAAMVRAAGSGDAFHFTLTQGTNHTSTPAATSPTMTPEFGTSSEIYGTPESWRYWELPQTYPAGEYLLKIHNTSGSIYVGRNRDLYLEGDYMSSGGNINTVYDITFRVYEDTSDPVEPEPEPAPVWFGNTNATGGAYALSTNVWFGQRFTSQWDFTKCEVNIATYATSTSDIEVRLKNVDTGQVVNQHAELNVTDGGWYGYETVEPLPAGTYDLEIKETSGTIAIWYANTDVSPDGYMISNGSALSSGTYDCNYRVYPVQGPLAKRWDGSQWITCSVRRFNGSSWVNVRMTRY